MATILQGSSGNFSDTSTWVGGVVPVEDDHIVSYAGFILNIDASISLGSSQQSGGWPASFAAANTAAPSAAIWMRNGTLTIADDVALTLKGDLILMNSVTTIGAGVTITIDPTAADVTGTNAAGDSLVTSADTVGANRFYVIDIGMDYGRHNIEGRLTINGTSANPTTIQCAAGGTSFFLAGNTMTSGKTATHSSGCIDATYTHFKNFGASPAELSISANYSGTLLQEKGFNRGAIVRAFAPRLSSEATNTTHANDIKFSMSYCVLEDTTGIQPPYGVGTAGSRAQISFDYCRAKATKYWLGNLSFMDFTQTLDVSDAVTNTSLKVTANVTPFRRIKNCSWDRYFLWIDGGAGWEIENNIFACGFDILTNAWLGHAPISFSGNTIIRSRIFNLPAAKAEFTQPAAWDDGTLASTYGKSVITTPSIAFQALPYGTGKRDPNIPSALRTEFGDSTTAPFATLAGRMGIGSFIKDNYFLEDHATANPHVLKFVGGIGDGAHLVMDNIWEVGDADGQGECVVTAPEFDAERTTPTHETGACYYSGNINLPSKNSTEAGTFWVTTPNTNYPAGWQGTDPNTGTSNAGTVILGSTYHDDSFQIAAGSGTWWMGHFPQIFTNNTFFTGASEGPINVCENGYSRDLLRYAKNNMFWDTTVRTTVVWSIGDVSNRIYPDLVIPENVNNNIKINQYGTAHTTGGYNFTTETHASSTYYGEYFNANGYRGLDLSNPTTSVTYTPLAGGANVTVERRNYFGRDDAEFLPSVSDLPFVNYLNGTPRYSLSYTGIATNAEAWQLISKEHDWTDADQLNGMTHAGLLSFVREASAPVRTSNGFTSVLNDVDVNPASYYDPEMTTGGNPLGNYGELTYAATDDANKGLIAINAIYQAVE